MDPSSPLYPQFSTLYEKITSQMAIQEEVIRIGAESFRLVSVKNVDELLENMIQLDEDHVDVQDERIPYWAELWPSAIALGGLFHASRLDRTRYAGS